MANSVSSDQYGIFYHYNNVMKFQASLWPGEYFVLWTYFTQVMAVVDKAGDMEFTYEQLLRFRKPCMQKWRRRLNDSILLVFLSYNYNLMCDIIRKDWISIFNRILSVWPCKDCPFIRIFTREETGATLSIFKWKASQCCSGLLFDLELILVTEHAQEIQEADLEQHIDVTCFWVVSCYLTENSTVPTCPTRSPSPTFQPQWPPSTARRMWRQQCGCTCAKKKKEQATAQASRARIIWATVDHALPVQAVPPDRRSKRKGIYVLSWIFHRFQNPEAKISIKW